MHSYRVAPAGGEPGSDPWPELLRTYTKMITRASVVIHLVTQLSGYESDNIMPSEIRNAEGTSLRDELENMNER